MSSGRRFVLVSAIMAGTLSGVALVAPGVASASTAVTNCNDSGAGSLRAAVASGGTVTFALSPACPTITLTSGPLTLATSVTVSGPGLNALTVSAGFASQVFVVNAGVIATISGLTIESGSATTEGGGIYNGGTLTLTNSAVSGNLAGTNGGGIYNGGTLTLTNSTLFGNSAKDDGAGIYNGAGRLTITSSKVLGNSTDTSNTGVLADGGGIYNIGTLRFTSSVLASNIADEGGGVDTSGALTLINSTVLTNRSVVEGGGIFNSGALTLENSTVSGNNADEGGGVSNLGAFASLLNSTVSRNKGTSDAGGIYNNAPLTITNSTVADNNAHDGGGIVNDNTATLTNSTVSGNSAVYGGGIYVIDQYGTLTLANSIVADPSGGDCSFYPGATLADGGYNLDRDGTCGLSASTDRSKVDPKLGPLGANGGPTQTMALASSSPALNAILPGANGCGTTTTTDQRGVPRPQGSGCDIGAFEYAPPTISGVLFTGPVNSPTVIITGSGLGAPFATVKAGCGATGNDYAYSQLFLEDVTRGWYAGIPGDCIGLTNMSYTNTKILFQLGSYYDSPPWSYVLDSGDRFRLSVDGFTVAAYVAYPTITSVVFTGSPTTPIVTINGSGFGTHPAGAALRAGSCGGTGNDYVLNELYLADTSASWLAGQPPDCIGLTNVRYGDTRIVFGLGSYYTTNGFALSLGHAFAVGVAGATKSGVVVYS